MSGRRPSPSDPFFCPLNIGATCGAKVRNGAETMFRMLSKIQRKSGWFSECGPAWLTLLLPAPGAAQLLLGVQFLRRIVLRHGAHCTTGNLSAGGPGSGTNLRRANQVSQGIQVSGFIKIRFHFNDVSSKGTYCLFAIIQNNKPALCDCVTA